MSVEQEDTAAKLERYLYVLDRAARYYIEALKHVIEECDNDKPRIDHIRKAAERGLRLAIHELETTEMIT